jgi:hypothetical protein
LLFMDAKIRSFLHSTTYNFNLYLLIVNTDLYMCPDICLPAIQEGGAG